LEPFFFETLEAVGAGSRLECSASQRRGSRLFDELGDGDDLLLTFHRAWAGDYRNLFATDAQRTSGDDGAVALHLLASDFVGREDGNHFVDAFDDFESLTTAVTAFRTDRGDNRPLGPHNDMGFQTQTDDSLFHVFDLRLGGAGFHDDNHFMALKLR